MTEWIAGVDQSLSACAVVAVPVDLWSRKVPSNFIESEVFSSSKGSTFADECHRMEGLAGGLTAWLRDRKVRRVWFEAPAYGGSKIGVRLGGLLHVLATSVQLAGITPHLANMASARKLLLGTIVGEGHIKQRVAQTCIAAGVVLETLDEYDGFCVVNYALSECTYRALATPAPIKKPRKRAA